QELSDLAATRGDRHLQSLFIGGGTPSVLPCLLLVELLEYCRELFPPAQETEISVEANPGTVNDSYLRALLAAGVNRISFGVQSFNNQELQVLGRIHDGAAAIEAVQAAKNAGFTNINIDLMYGLPGQTVASWRASLEQAIALCPQHLSLYQLTIEEGTPFHQALATAKITLPEEEAILLMDEVTERLCSEAVMRHYEISNFARPGYECVHNINYWHNGEYLACGASAVSCVEGLREKRIADPWEYIRRIKEGIAVVVESECLPADASFRESVIMGLRMTQGVSIARLKARYGIDIAEYYWNVLGKLIDLRLVEVIDSHLRLTVRGRSFANGVMAELV
ncbi:MAG: radical SAM family heme chaperone HemW, partial [Desulfoprunum sp.]|nr:radical SAM family heme chaperone HemW [Desulfoprunum sp.]